MSLRSAIAALLATGAILAAASPVAAQSEPTPIVIGQSYALPSGILGATREINVWLPPGYAESGPSYPVLYLLDGGTTWQDFHHISGLAQLGTVNGTTRDIILIGIASMDRRNELALPTENPDLIARYPTHGQSERFRRFIADEVQPFVEARFRTNGETALMGESLAGLFVVEAFLKEPQMFDAWVAVSPSLWWDGGRLAQQSGDYLRDHSTDARTLILTMGNEGAEAQALMETLTANLREHATPALTWTFQPRPDDTHATIYHGAALDAFRRLYAVPPPAN